MTSNDNERIYFGSREIFFKRVSGEVLKYRVEDWRQEKTLEQIAEVVRRLEPQNIDGVDLPVVLPGIPAFDFIHKSELHQVNGVNLPDLFQTPLIKCPKDDPSAMISGLASGVRSGLVQVHNRWYRLKGCGNHDQGFPLRKRLHPVSSSGQQIDWCDIRGCAFMNTALRELFYTETLPRLSDPLCPIISANHSVGLIKYSDPDLLPCGSTVQTTCIVQQTIGDRRFGTHILAGIELLLPSLISEELISSQELLNLFPDRRPGRERNKLSEIIPTGPFISDYTLGTSQHGNDHETQGLCWPEIPRDGSSLANVTSPTCSFPLRAPLPSQYPSQWTNEGPREMTEDWKSLWDLTVEKLKVSLARAHEKNKSDLHSHKLLSDTSAETMSEQPAVYVTHVLNYLFSRCGYDCGRILSTMHSHRISWGTYQDAMCRRDFDEWHCNAHANNLVLIPPQTDSALLHSHTNSHSFLSFLDLDMAFGEEEMIQVTQEADSEPRSGSAMFSNILWREYVNMMEVLAGNDSSTGVPNAALSVTQSYSPVLRSVQSALSDTMVLAYQEAYQCHQSNDRKRGAVMDYDEELHQAAYCLLELAIIVMAEYIA
jgi:hypothetical protein